MKPLQTFTYSNKGKKTKIYVELCGTIWKKFRGLMFQRNSPPLLFLFDKNQNITIHSFFCKPFIAIWLDDKKQVIKVVEIKKWKPYFSCYGRYLLEIPFIEDKNFHLRMINSPTGEKRNI